MGTLHCALENGADLHVNECQKVDTIALGLLKKKNAKSRFFYFARCIRKLRYYGNNICDIIRNKCQNEK